MCSVCAATALVSTPSSGSPVKGEFSQDTIFFDYSKILECCSTPLLFHIRHPPSLGTKILESSIVDLNPPLVFQNIGEKNSAHMIVSWSCLFSKHTVILTPQSQGYPAAQSSFCKDSPPVTATISCRLSLTLPWPKRATEDFHSCSSLCYLTMNLPFIFQIFLLNQLTWSHIH